MVFKPIEDLLTGGRAIISTGRRRNDYDRDGSVSLTAVKNYLRDFEVIIDEIKGLEDIAKYTYTKMYPDGKVIIWYTDKSPKQNILGISTWPPPHLSFDFPATHMLLNKDSSSPVPERVVDKLDRKAKPGLWRLMEILVCASWRYPKVALKSLVIFIFSFVNRSYCKPSPDQYQPSFPCL